MVRKLNESHSDDNSKYITHKGYLFKYEPMVGDTVYVDVWDFNDSDLGYSGVGEILYTPDTINGVDTYMVKIKDGEEVVEVQDADIYPYFD